MVSIVYPLGKGSRLQNLEIRYSLRSVAEFAENFDKIFIIGEKPDFLNWSETLVHIPFDDRYTPYLNTWLKLREISEQKDVSEKFCFFNDDFFLIDKFDCSDVPYVTSGLDLHEQYFSYEPLDKIKNGYHKVLRKTMEALRNRKLTTYAFNTHQPVNFEKQKIAATFQEFSGDLWQHELSFRACYGNLHKIERTRKPAIVLGNKIKSMYGHKSFALTNATTYDFAYKILNSFFPEKSLFEV